MYSLILGSIIVSLISVEVSSDSSRADPCELYIDILSESPLRDNKDFWNCMIYYGTNYTYATVKYFPVGPRAGLFQIQSPTWCKFDGQDDKGKNYCNINCNKFLDSNLTDDIKCVYKIYQQYGLPYWKSWNDLCGGPTNELIDFCF